MSLRMISHEFSYSLDFPVHETPFNKCSMIDLSSFNISWKLEANSKIPSSLRSCDPSPFNHTGLIKKGVMNPRIDSSLGWNPIKISFS